MADLVYTVLARSDQDGALVGDPGPVTLIWQGLTNPQQLQQYINGRLIAAEQALPEQTRCELTIAGWTVAGRSYASWVASKIQDAWTQGRIVDPDTNQPVAAWPEYPQQIAWGDDSTDKITIRAVKNFPVLWVIVGVAIIIIGVWLWQMLRQSSWVASSAQPTPQQANPGGLPTPGQIGGWFVRNWPWVLLAGAAVAATPWLIRQRARIVSAEHDLQAAERGEEV